MHHEFPTFIGSFEKVLAYKKGCLLNWKFIIVFKYVRVFCLTGKAMYSNQNTNVSRKYLFIVFKEFPAKNCRTVKSCVPFHLHSNNFNPDISTSKQNSFEELIHHPVKFAPQVHLLQTESLVLPRSILTERHFFTGVVVVAELALSSAQPYTSRP